MALVKFKPPITARRPRFALVGCGRIANNHFGAFEQFRDRAELVAVCDIDPADDVFEELSCGEHAPDVTRQHLIEASEED